MLVRPSYHVGPPQLSSPRSGEVAINQTLASCSSLSNKWRLGALPAGCTQLAAVMPGMGAAFHGAPRVRSCACGATTTATACLCISTDSPSLSPYHHHLGLGSGNMVP